MKLLKLSAAVAAVWIVVYLAMVFVLLEWNVFLWSANGRVTLVYFLVAVPWFVVGMPYMLWGRAK